MQKWRHVLIAPLRLRKNLVDRRYYRYSLENKLGSSSNITAREHLEYVTGSSVTPDSKKRSGNFLCHECWNRLGNSFKYKQYVKDFFEATEQESYVYSKRAASDIVQSPGTSFKRPRYTSTPVKVSTVLKQFMIECSLLR
ncbi:hypothetical protein DPMN_022222 [Dreissena polymorpha]|uniref:Uncharacterized protein n=1 Tax=Dreissena polymorpha TaxID=45954 RepID=A0A9D4NM61_DREPO|nr:hypothetical protein DPMN_022222 [Dreissena polymorpha]